MRNEQIERLRAMADDARKQYDADLAAGGEPVYPAWIDDVREVCAELERANSAMPADAHAANAHHVGECTHSAPHRYCAQCVETPCPIGLGGAKA